MTFKQYLISFVAIGFLFGCGETSISSENPTDPKTINELQTFNDLDLVQISHPWKMEHLDLLQARSEEKPILLYFNGYGSVNSRYFEDRILSAPHVFDLLDNQFTVFNIKSDDKRIHRLIKPNGDTIKEPMCDWWSTYQIERYGVFESPFCDIVNFENESLVKKKMNGKNADAASFVSWLMLGLDNFRNRKKENERRKNELSLLPEFKIQTQADFDAVLEESSKQDKPVLVNFTGYNVVGFDISKNEIWIDDLVYPILKNEMIIASIYVDDKTAVSSEFLSDSIQNYGDYWSHYEKERYQMETNPIFDIVNSENKSMVEDIAIYSSHGTPALYKIWLEKGLTDFYQNRD